MAILQPKINSPFVCFSEIGEIVATNDPKKKFENEDLNWFVDQLTVLLAFPNPYVQVTISCLMCGRLTHVAVQSNMHI